MQLITTNTNSYNVINIGSVIAKPLTKLNVYYSFGVNIIFTVLIILFSSE